MTSDFDLAKALREWPYKPDQFDARCVELPDGREVLQVRVDLGLLQMELQGRPDGCTVDGWPSVLERCRSEHDADPAGFTISNDTCDALQAEALQVMRRCMTLQTMGMFERVLHDADSILRRMDLCACFAPKADSTSHLERLRPQSITMRARAGAQLALGAGNQAAARTALDSGLRDLQVCVPAKNFESSPDVQLLRNMHALLIPRLPASQRVELETRMQAAITRENFELAAILRDELRQLPD